jgi:hypothetical protein
MADQDQSVTLPLNVDPTPAIEALKAFLSVCTEVGTQSQKLLSGEMLAPSFGAIDSQVRALSTSLEQYNLAQRAEVSESTAVVASHESQAAAAEVESQQQMTLADTIRASRSEHRMGMFAVMGLINAVEGFTGRNTEMVRAVDMSAQSAFGASFAMRALGLSMDLAVPAAIAIGAFAAVKAAIDAQKKAEEELQKVSEDNIALEVELGKKSKQAQLDQTNRDLKEAQENYDKLNASMGSLLDLTVVLASATQSVTNLWKSNSDVIKEVADAYNKLLTLEKKAKEEGQNSTVSAHGSEMATNENQMLEYKTTQMAAAVALAETEYQYHMIDVETLQEVYQKQLAITTDQKTRLDIANKIFQIDAQLAAQTLSMGLAGLGIEGGRTTSSTEPPRSNRDADREYELRQLHAETMKNAMEKENALYEAEVQHVKATESDKELADAKIAALEFEHQTKMAEIEERAAEKRQREFEQSWSNAEKLGQILGEAFSHGNTGAEKMARTLQLMLQIAKEIAFMNQAAAGTSTTGGFLNIIGELAQIAFLAEGGVVTHPTFSVVGESGPEAIIPLSSLASFNVNYGSSENSALIEEIRGLKETIINHPIEIHSELDIQKFRRATIDNNRNERFRKPA